MSVCYTALCVCVCVCVCARVHLFMYIKHNQTKLSPLTIYHFGSPFLLALLQVLVKTMHNAQYNHTYHNADHLHQIVYDQGILLEQSNEM